MLMTFLHCLQTKEREDQMGSVQQSHQSLDASGLWLSQPTSPAAAYLAGGGLMNFYKFHPKRHAPRAHRSE